MLNDTVITVGKRSLSDNVALAKKIAETWRIKYVSRNRLSIDEIKTQEKVSHVLVVKKNKLALQLEEGEFFFHPNLSSIRLKNLQNGGSDYLLTALNIGEGAKILDCTLGFGSDAIVESYGVGNTGKVVALEKNPLIAKIIEYGLKNSEVDNPIMEKAMRQIEVVESDALTFLKSQPDNSFDAVYFDPMFRHPLMESENLRPLRALAETSPISVETITEAKRVAKYRVVLKENARSLEFERLGFGEFVGGKYSKIKFGVIHTNL